MLPGGAQHTATNRIRVKPPENTEDLRAVDTGVEVELHFDAATPLRRQEADAPRGAGSWKHPLALRAQPAGEREAARIDRELAKLAVA